MTVPEYTAGDWTVVVRPGLVALLGPQVGDATVRAVWDAAAGSVLDVLAVLARDGLGSLPPFGLVAAAPSGVHVALRGEVEVVLDGEVLTSGAVSTWTERVVEGRGEVAVRRAGSADAAPALPLVEGVVRAAGVRLAAAAVARDRAGASDEVAVPALPEPVLVEPVLPDPVLVDPVLVDPVLPDPVLADPVLPDPVLAEAVLEAAPFAAPELVPQADPEPAPLRAGELAVAVPSGPVPLVPVDGASADDHDGLTILSSDLVAIRDQLPAWAADDAPAPFRAPEQPAPASRIVLSTGLVVDLDRAVLVGRAPQVSRVANSELPRLVAVPSPQQDISRTHAEVRTEGELVLVTDLDSTNGVHVARPGEGSRRLHPGEPTIVEPGEVVDLGDGVTFVVERSA